MAWLPLIKILGTTAIHHGPQIMQAVEKMRNRRAGIVPAAQSYDRTEELQAELQRLRAELEETATVLQTAAEQVTALEQRQLQLLRTLRILLAWSALLTVGVVVALAI